MTYENEWFSGRQSIRELPLECIADFRGPGDKTEACKYWVEALNFDGPAWLIREHLRGYGAWNRTELCDHKSNLERLLFVWASDCAENGEESYPIYLMY